MLNPEFDNRLLKQVNRRKGEKAKAGGAKTIKNGVSILLYVHFYA